MLIQKQKKSKKENKSKLKRSQILLIGSLLVFAGVITLSYGRLQVLRELIYESVRLALSVEDTKKEDNISNGLDTPENVNQGVEGKQEYKPKINYNYIGYLEIPKIRLKRGFVDPSSRYNNIQYNVTISDKSNMPDVDYGNFILYAHSGDAYISFFAYLYKLNIGDYAYVTYNGEKYSYELVKVENVPKVGTLEIQRPNKNTKELTLITCTKDSDSEQTVYYFDIR
ncbi:MAG: sortase [Bacilli bacterium]|nr:sortase [Bacilli bacterium]